MDHYPPAHREDIVELLPADDPVVEVADPYRWLEDADSANSERWYRDQDELFRATASHWSTRAAFEARIRELLDVGYQGGPTFRQATDRVFSMRRMPGEEHGRLLVREGQDEPRVLVDPMQLDPTGATTLDSYRPSHDGRLLAYQLSTGGDEESLLRVMDVATGEIVDGPIDRCRYSPIAWLGDNDAFYYVRRLDPALLPENERAYHRRVYLHRLGTSPLEDVEIFGAGRAITSYYGVGVSFDGRWMTLSAAEGTDPRNDLWLADLRDADPADPPLRAVVEGQDAQTSPHPGRDGFLYLATDLEAPRGRLVVTELAHPTRQHWRTLIPERADEVLEDFVLLDGGRLAQAPVLVASWTRHATARITTHDPATGAQTGEISLPGVGTIGALSGRPGGGDECWFAYTDYATPTRILHLDGTTGVVSEWARPPGEVDLPDVATTQLDFPSRDGTTVRMFVVARQDLLDQNAAPREARPCILYGYGGFGHTMSPGYSASILSWVEAGGVYAVAGLRGGNEEGEAWHRDGMLANKQHVFDDFLAAADALVETGWTSVDRLGISGGSNGGLLVGAALTQRPDAFAAVVCSAPLLDMVRYQLHGLGVSWTGEYGDAAKLEELRWLLAYSPYHHVTHGVRYPATLFTVFAGDTRVDPLHAAKLAAALQHATASPIDEAPILVRREVGVGHGARAVSRSVNLSADTMAFRAHHTGLESATAETDPALTDETD